MASSNSQIDKPQHGHPKRAELPDVNINTGAQSINTERASIKGPSQPLHFFWFTSGDDNTKLLERSTKEYLITRRNNQAVCRMIS